MRILTITWEETHNGTYKQFGKIDTLVVNADGVVEGSPSSHIHYCTLTRCVSSSEAVGRVRAAFNC